MKSLKSIMLMALAVLVTVACVPAASVSAQSSSLSIAPKKNYLIEPGGTTKDKLTVRNLDNTSDLELYLRVVDFTYTDESGTPKLLLDTDAELTTWSLRSYMNVPESISIPKGKSASVDISVSMPKGIGAGSYYSAIVYSTSAPDASGNGNVGLAASGTTLAFVTVPGKMNEDMVFTKLGAYDKVSRKYTYIATNEPQVIGYTLENKGNVAEAPVGSMTLKNLLFGFEYRIPQVNPSKSLALIGQTRTFEACVKTASQEKNFTGDTNEGNQCVSAGLWPGLYSVNAELFYGQNGNLTKELHKNAYFWYLPLWFIVILAILALVVAFYVWRIVVWNRGGSFKLGGRPHTRKSSRRRR
jgi:hypothetical protein